MTRISLRADKWRLIEGTKSNYIVGHACWQPANTSFKLRSEYAHRPHSQKYWMETDYPLSRFGGEELSRRNEACKLRADSVFRLRQASAEFAVERELEPKILMAPLSQVLSRRFTPPELPGFPRGLGSEAFSVLSRHLPRSVGAKVAELTDPDSLVIEGYLADGMEYVLLVHNSSPFKKLADLRDARIVSHLHREMVLLPAWRSTMLAANNLPQPEQFFASHELRDRLNMVVLPVFFRRVDAACLARRNWETAVELSPQLGRDVRALAVSPKVVPISFAP